MAIKEGDFLVLPEYWQLTPLGKIDQADNVNPKAPYLTDWQNKDIDRAFIQSEIDAGKAVGIGLRLGEPSGCVVAIDFDGQSAINLGRESFGEIPATVTWTSGRPGRYQALFFVPEQYRDRVKNKTVKTGVIGDDDKAEQLEFRYTGNQSVLPPSPHPTTEGYKWISNPIDTPVAELPQSAIDYWLTLIEPKVKQQKTKRKPQARQQQPKIANSDIPPIPLKNCLAKSNQNLLGGVSEGGRNQAGTALSRDLIGCAKYLDSEEIPYDGDPRDLFDRFCSSCSPPLDRVEGDTIWNSAEGDNPSPSCTSEGVDKILAAWDRKIKKEQKESTPSALEMSKAVFKDLFKNVIRFDASVRQFWRYDGKGMWITCSNEYIFYEVRKYLEETITDFSPSYVRNVIEFAIGDILHEGWTEASNLRYIPFINGVLELKTGQLLAHSPDYGFTWQLPRPYSAIAASWEKIDKFLNTFSNGNPQLKDIAIAFCVAVITGRSDLQKVLYLFGSGANGKGAFMGLLSMLVGKENTHSTTIAELNESRFESANLMNKRLVLMTDEDKRVGGLSVFKSATGQDPIRYERKGKDATNFIFKGMFVIAANSPTFVGDSSFAVKRRKVDFPCLARIAECDRRDLTPEFEADLTAFTTYLLSISDEWVTATIRGAGSVEAVKQLNWEMTVREDSIAAFYDEKLIIDPNGSIACGKLYKDYQSYCEDSGLKSKSIKNFTPSLLELCNDSLGLSISHKHSRTGKVIDGLRFREEWEFEFDPKLTDEKTSSPINNF
jgi:P4 family phage/plasmid primase-like protien